MSTTSQTSSTDLDRDRELPVYEILARDLQAMNVECVFGLMSDDTAELAVTLDAFGIRLYGARHENNAITMAEGYAAATGGLGIALVGRGPATANGLHGTMYALRSGSKVLIIYGEAAIGPGAPNSVGPDYKAFNAMGVLTSAGLPVFRPTSATAARAALADAVRFAHGGTATALLLPVDVQRARMRAGESTDEPGLRAVSRKPGAGSAASIGVAVQILERSKKPLIIAGRGAHRAGARAQLERLAERTGALLATTARAKEMFDGHPFNLGIIGSFSNSMARRHIEQADCVMVFGGSLNQYTTSFGTSIPEAPLIQIDADRANIGRWLNADVAIVGDAREVAGQLLEAVSDRGDSAKPFHAPGVMSDIASFDLRQDFEPANTARTVDPRSLGLALDGVLPRKRNLVYDGGHFLGIVPYMKVPGPDHFKFTTDFASIGIGFGTALGFARARPDHTTVLIIGDGGFMMTLSELETAAREDLPLVVVVLNDCAYGAELHLLKLHQLPVEKSIFADVDFGPIAEGFGFESATVRSLDDLQAIAPMVENPQGPILLDCKVNPEVMFPVMAEAAAYAANAD